MSGEGKTKAEAIFAAGYAGCAILAFMASRMQSNPGVASTAPFWLRIAILCAIFAVLRYFGVHMAVNEVVHEFSVSAGLTDWKRPGPYLMLGAMIAFGAAVAGLLLFRSRTLHGSVKGAAIAIILIALFAVGHSLSLYTFNYSLETKVGPLTISRIIEAIFLLYLAYCEIWYISDARKSAAVGNSV